MKTKVYLFDRQIGKPLFTQREIYEKRNSITISFRNGGFGTAKGAAALFCSNVYSVRSDYAYCNRYRTIRSLSTMTKLTLTQAVLIYNEMRENVDMLENGTWQEDGALPHMSIERIELMVGIVHLAEEKGLGVIASSIN